MRKSLHLVILVGLAGLAVFAVVTSCSDVDSAVGVATIVAVTGAAVLVERKTVLRLATVREEAVLPHTGPESWLIPWAAVTEPRFVAVHSRSNTSIDVELTLADGRKERICPSEPTSSASMRR